MQARNLPRVTSGCGTPWEAHCSEHTAKVSNRLSTGQAGNLVALGNKRLKHQRVCILFLLLTNNIPLILRGTPDKRIAIGTIGLAKIVELQVKPGLTYSLANLWP